jgi:hypothetical protein
MYSLTSGVVSDDSEHIFYSLEGSSFGKSGEASVVEAYSIRNLARMRAVTFGFGDGYYIRKTQLIRSLRIQGPIYIGIDTSSFGGDDNSKNSPPIIASSDHKLHWNFQGIGYVASSRFSHVFLSTRAYSVSSQCLITLEALFHHSNPQRLLSC